MSNMGGISHLAGLDGIANIGDYEKVSSGMEGLTALPIVNSNADPRARLRVTNTALYDAEDTGTSAISSLPLFATPVGGAFVNNSTVRKTLGDTNLRAAGALGSPMVFDLFSFNIKARPATGVTPVTEADLMRLYVNAYFEFAFNNRPFLQIPLSEIPCGTGFEGVSTLSSDFQMHNGVGLRSNSFKFNVEKYRVRIHSTENFNATIYWPTAAVTFVVNTRIQVLANGYLYNGI